jgi:NitT/TauT family transport system substrate-binding protein
MKKFIASFISILLLVGCSNSTNTATSTIEPTSIPTIESTEETVINTDLKIIAPSGAPALSQLGAILQGYDVEIVDGPDKLQAELINSDSEYDVIVAPTNLGIKLAANGKSEYKLLEVVTFGNLYLVGPEDADLENCTIAGFGEQAVTGLVFKSIYPELADKVNWGYASVSEAQAALLSDEADVAILAEPVATATISKAKEQGKELTILADLQELWNSGEGYPQAGIFVKENSYEENTESYDAYITTIERYIQEVSDNDDTTALAETIDSIGVETLSVPSSAIITKVWDRLNIHPTRASGIESEIEEFLKLFDVEEVSNAIIH